MAQIAPETPQAAPDGDDEESRSEQEADRIEDPHDAFPIRARLTGLAVVV
jgi:hypothetical protein